MMESAEFVVGGCRSVCDHQDNASYCDIGINCCQTTIPPYLTVMSALILYQEKESRKADCDDYAFLVDRDWFEKLCSAHEIKSRGNVPVVLEWNIINSTSSLALFGSYVIENLTRDYYNYTYCFEENPFCKI